MARSREKVEEERRESTMHNPPPPGVISTTAAKKILLSVSTDASRCRNEVKRPEEMLKPPGRDRKRKCRCYPTFPPGVGAEGTPHERVLDAKTAKHQLALQPEEIGHDPSCGVYKAE
jgi:hypothetical protein